MGRWERAGMWAMKREGGGVAGGEAEGAKCRVSSLRKIPSNWSGVVRDPLYPIRLMSRA